jgi:hypothetical protein
MFLVTPDESSQWMKGHSSESGGKRLFDEEPKVRLLAEAIDIKSQARQAE